MNYPDTRQDDYSCSSGCVYEASCACDPCTGYGSRNARSMNCCRLGCYGRRDQCCGRNAAIGIIAFFAFLLAFAIGLILGAVFYETLLPILASIIVFAAVILAIIIGLLIYYHYRRKCC